MILSFLQVFFYLQPSYYQILIKVAKCQADSITTHKCELCQSEFSVVSGRLRRPNECAAEI